jgi:hypothetical protein
MNTGPTGSYQQPTGPNQDKGLLPMSQAKAITSTITRRDRHTLSRARAAKPEARLGWWDERAIGWNVPQPNELIIHAALNMPADIWLDTPEALTHVANSYIKACTDAGYFLHHTSHIKCYVGRSTLSGYRSRLKEYHACLAHYLREAR